MKKLTCVLLTYALLLLCGCTLQENTLPTTHPSDPTKPLIIYGRDVFTDAFFADVKEISVSGCGSVDQSQMEPVVNYLQRLSLIETDEHLSNADENGDMLIGLSHINFVKSDGTELIFLSNHAMITLSDGSLSYFIVGDNLISGLREVFDQALNDGDKYNRS